MLQTKSLLGVMSLGVPRSSQQKSHKGKRGSFFLLAFLSSKTRKISADFLVKIYVDRKRKFRILCLRRIRAAKSTRRVCANEAAVNQCPIATLKALYSINSHLQKLSKALRFPLFIKLPSRQKVYRFPQFISFSNRISIGRVRRARDNVQTPMEEC